MVKPETTPICVSDSTDNARVLEWAKNVPPLQLSKGTVDNMPLRPGQTLTSMSTILGVPGESPIHGPQEMMRGGTFVPRRTKIVAPLDTTRLYHGPALAQRRADKQLAKSSAEFVQSAPDLALLRPATLHTAPVSGVSVPITSSQAACSSSSQATSSQPLYLASHTQSLAWKRPANLGVEHCSVNPELAKWTKVEQDLLRMGLIKRVPGKLDSGSFVVPKTFEQWLEFRAGRAEDALAENATKIRRRNFEVEVAERLRKIHSFDSIHGYLTPHHGFGKRVKIGHTMGGKDYRDGRGTVLAHPSTWSPWYQSTEERPEALWPCLEEMKEEGDERHTSAFGRFPALPRVPGNPTVVWKVKPVISALPFDEVWKLPNKDTWADLYCQKPRDSDEGYMEGLVGQSLLDAIDVCT